MFHVRNLQGTHYFKSFCNNSSIVRKFLQVIPDSSKKCGSRDQSSSKRRESRRKRINKLSNDNLEDRINSLEKRVTQLESDKLMLGLVLLPFSLFLFC